MLSAFIKSINRQQWVSEAAYYKALARDFDPPNLALRDWLEAEQDFSVMLINLQLNVLGEDGAVSTMGLRQIAESLGVQNPELMRTEMELIHAIQYASHHNTCFQPQGTGYCDEQNCPWRFKCRRLVAIWYR
jgi:hypothetical protein